MVWRVSVPLPGFSQLQANNESPGNAFNAGFSPVAGIQSAASWIETTSEATDSTGFSPVAGIQSAASLKPRWLIRLAKFQSRCRDSVSCKEVPWDRNEATVECFSPVAGIQSAARLLSYGGRRCVECFSPVAGIQSAAR